MIEYKRAVDKASVNKTGQYIVTRIETSSGEQELIRLPLDLVDKSVTAGVESLKNRGMLETEHICLIAVPRGSLTSTFTYIYEVVRKSGWSVLPLGGSDDGQDISWLCNSYNVDTLIVASELIKPILTSSDRQLKTVRNLMYVSGFPSQEDLQLIESQFPLLAVRPFMYYSDFAGLIGLPTVGSENDGFDAPERIIVEVESREGVVSLNGSGHILVTVPGIDSHSVVRHSLGYEGVLTTTERMQTVRFGRGGEQ